MRHHYYTVDEKEWLARQDKTLTYKELTMLFNEKFGQHRTVSQISDLCAKRMHIKRAVNKGRFSDGAKPKFAVGEEVIKQGYVWVKVNDEYFRGYHMSMSDYKKNWRRKSDVVWEQANGAIPKGCFLVFLDGNPLNCELDNLYPVNRKIHAIMCKNQWYTENREVTLFALKTAELMRAVAAERRR